MNMRQRFLLVAAAVIWSILMVSCQKSGVEAAREDTSGVTPREIVSRDEKNFLIDAEKSEIRQKALAEAALEKSKNSDVRDFAKRLVQDRDRALTELTELMKAKNITQPAALADEVQLEAAKRLHRSTGTAFDHEFVSLIVAEQQEMVRGFDRASETAADPDVRSYAARVLPSVRKDFETANKLLQIFRAKTTP